MSDSENESVQLSTREGYDRWATIYDDEDNPLIVLEQEHVEQVMGDVRGLRILDSGCGTGRHSHVLARAGANVTAIDFSDGMLKKARAKEDAHLVEFIEHDIESELPFSDGHFDRVISALVVDHVANLKGYFAELHRVCRHDGLVVITVMHPALMLRGVQARFTDPGTGMLTLPQSEQHQVSDYVMAAVEAGLSIQRVSEHLVDETLAAKSDRAQRYLGWPMLLFLELTPCQD